MVMGARCSSRSSRGSGRIWEVVMFVPSLGDQFAKLSLRPQLISRSCDLVPHHKLGFPDFVDKGPSKALIGGDNIWKVNYCIEVYSTRQLPLNWLHQSWPSSSLSLTRNLYRAFTAWSLLLVLGPRSHDSFNQA